MKYSLRIDRFIIATILIFVGGGFLLDNLGLIDFDFGDFISTFWPTILILFGIKIMLDAVIIHKNKGASIATLLVGLFLTLLGWNFLADELGWPEFDFSLFWKLFWPLLLIYIGFRLLVGKKETKIVSKNESDDEQSYEWLKKSIHYDGTEMDSARKYKKVYKSSIIGDFTLRDYFELEDLHLWNAIGDVDIDFTKAMLQDRETEVTIKGWIGDIDVVIPREIPVFVEVQLLIGEFKIFDQRGDGISKKHVYKSPGYDEAIQKLHLIVDVKLGDVRIVEV
jgi:lia operon protein LiaF